MTVQAKNTDKTNAVKDETTRNSHDITTSRRFKCVIRKWATPLDILASGLGFIPWGIHFGSRRTSVE